MNNHSSEQWDKFHNERNKDFNYPKWPDDNMLRVIFGSYNKYNKLKTDKKFKVLDIGCGFGNNLVPFLEIGCDCYGVEISSKIINVTKKSLMSRYDINNKNFLVGNNRKIPFPDSYFDLVISSDVIHYEANEKNFKCALTEYARVIKKNKYLYLSTTGPKHDFFKKSDYKGYGISIIKDFDFRNGQKFYFVSDKRILNYYLKSNFKKIDNFSSSSTFYSRSVDRIGAFCIKK